MNKIFKCALASLALFATLGTQAEAALVRVEFDSFALSGSPETVFTSGALTVTRTISTNSGTAPTISGGNLILSKNSSATVTYNVTNGTFGDVFATGAVSAASFDGFSFNAAWTQQSNIGNGSGVSISVGGTEVVSSAAIGTGDNDFRFIADPTATLVSFTFTNSFPGGGKSAANLVIGSISAVPEPSALLLVGSVLGLGFLRRRRR